MSNWTAINETKTYYSMTTGEPRKEQTLLVKDGDHNVAYVSVYHPTPEKNLALIAAAPDLLRAAEMALQLYDTYPLQGMTDERFLEECGGTSEGIAISKQTIATRNWLRKIIAKAEGCASLQEVSNVG